MRKELIPYLLITILVISASVVGQVQDIRRGGGSGGSAPVGTVVNSGTPVAGAIPIYSGVTGTNIQPSNLTISGDTNAHIIKWPSFFHTPSWTIAQRWTANGDGTTNDVVSYGYNTVAGNQEIAGKPTLTLNFENDYLGQTEMHFDSVDTNGVACRPIWFNAPVNGAYIEGGVAMDTFTVNRSKTNQTMFSVGAAGLTATSDRAYTNSVSYTITDDGTQVAFNRTGGKTANLTLRPGWGDVFVPGVDFKTTLTEFQNVPAYASMPANIGRIGLNGNGAAGSAGLSLSSDMQLRFSTHTNLYASGGTSDSGVAKDSAGVVRISNGSTGTGSIKLNDIFGSRAKVLISTSAADFLYVAVPNTNAIGGDVIWEIISTDGTDTQSQSGRTRFDAVAKSTTVTAGLTTITNNAVVSAGTLTALIASNVTTNNVWALGVTATTSLTTTNLVIKWRLETPGAFTVNSL